MKLSPPQSAFADAIRNFDGTPVRVGGTPERPLFAATDVCVVLGIQNASDALAKGLDEDEKDVASIYTPGGRQQLACVTESGLYHLIFKSRKAAAKRFRRWVTDEVLPEIRRAGRYEAQPATPAIDERDVLQITPPPPPTRRVTTRPKVVPEGQRRGSELFMVARDFVTLTWHPTLEGALSVANEAMEKAVPRHESVQVLKVIAKAQRNGIEWKTVDNDAREFLEKGALS